jgi:two-component system, NarL family, invasion response regulator UvrY
MKMISISLVDDHPMFRNGMAGLIQSFEGYSLLNQSGNGKEFIDLVQAGQVPDIAILDFQMPVMNGEETALWLKQHYPSIKVLSLTMFDDERHILKMIKAGARGYVLKSAEPEEMKLALDQIWTKGFYHTELVSSALMKNLQGEKNSAARFEFSEKEMEFLNLICTEMTYKEIADQMQISVRAVDTLREVMFERTNTKSRVGLALFGIKSELVKI